jgi:biopolymer transport protein ExbD
MSSQARKKQAVHVGPNMTPMVDIVMCILIFFMLGSSFAIQELYLTNNVPVSTKGLGTKVSDVKLPAIQKRLRMYRIGGAVKTTKVEAFDKTLEGIDDLHPSDTSNSRLDEIADFLRGVRKQMSDDVQIVIAPERDVPYQDVVTMYDLCMRAQFKTVAFAPPG